MQMLVAPQRYKGTSFSDKEPTRLCLLTCTASRQMLVAPQRYKGTIFSEKGPTRLCLLTCTACLACACPSQEQQDFPLFPTKSPPNSSKRSEFIKKIDENGSN